MKMRNEELIKDEKVLFYTGYGIDPTSIFGIAKVFSVHTRTEATSSVLASHNGVDRNLGIENFNDFDGGRRFGILNFEEL